MLSSSPLFYRDPETKIYLTLVRMLLLKGEAKDDQIAGKILESPKVSVIAFPWHDTLRLADFNRNFEAAARDIRNQGSGQKKEISVSVNLSIYSPNGLTITRAEAVRREAANDASIKTPASAAAARPAPATISELPHSLTDEGVEHILTLDFAPGHVEPQIENSVQRVGAKKVKQSHKRSANDEQPTLFDDEAPDAAP
jgi:hypothetical protein